MARSNAVAGMAARPFRLTSDGTRHRTLAGAGKKTLIGTLAVNQETLKGVKRKVSVPQKNSRWQFASVKNDAEFFLLSFFLLAEELGRRYRRRH